MCDPGAAPKCEDTPHKGRVWSLSCTFWKRLLKKTRVNLNPPLRPALCNKVPGFVSLPMNSFATRALARELLLPCGTLFVALPPPGRQSRGEGGARPFDFAQGRLSEPSRQRAIESSSRMTNPSAACSEPRDDTRFFWIETSSNHPPLVAAKRGR